VTARVLVGLLLGAAVGVLVRDHPAVLLAVGGYVLLTAAAWSGVVLTLRRRRRCAMVPGRGAPEQGDAPTPRG
jgi:hypothetical protein